MQKMMDFLKDAEDGGQQVQAHVVQAIVNREVEWKKGHDYIKNPNPNPN
jgi:hypothetical protein